MNLVLTQEQTLLQDSVADFLRNEAPVAALRALRDARVDEGFTRPLWARFGEMGYPGILVPEEHEGLGLGMIEAGIVMEQIGRNLVASPLLASGVIAARALTLAGEHDPCCTKWLPGIASGGILITLAIDEGARHAPQRIGTRARPDGDDWILEGAKQAVLDGHVADHLLVAAHDGTGLALFLVDRASSGVSVDDALFADSRHAARIGFSGVRVAGERRIASGGHANEALEGALDAGRVALAAELLGIGSEVFERTLRYLNERRQFGRLIGEFQALQHRAAHLYTELEITRTAVMAALAALDARRSDAPRLVSLAKARAGATGTLAVQEGVQMHGGIGMTDALDIGLFMKRARACDQWLGDRHYHLDRYARLGSY